MNARAIRCCEKAGFKRMKVVSADQPVGVRPQGSSRSCLSLAALRAIARPLVREGCSSGACRCSSSQTGSDADWRFLKSPLAIRNEGRRAATRTLVRIDTSQRSKHR